MPPTTLENGPMQAAHREADAPGGRTAVARARVLLSKEALERARNDDIDKGNLLATARVAGMMAAKQAGMLIPTCRGVLLSGIDLEFDLDDETSSIEVRAFASTGGRTGVGMEAMTAASVAALTIVDMCQAQARDATITDVQLLAKTGGHSGSYRRD